MPVPKPLDRIRIVGKDPGIGFNRVVCPLGLVVPSNINHDSNIDFAGFLQRPGVLTSTHWLCVDALKHGGGVGRGSAVKLAQTYSPSFKDSFIGIFFYFFS